MSPTRMNGLGWASRDTGHRRVPAPPDKMTGNNISFFMLPPCVLLMFDILITLTYFKSDQAQPVPAGAMQAAVAFVRQGRA